MATDRAPRRDELHATPFRLKRHGAFTEALDAYARLYSDSVERASPKMAELCFEQMFDTSLLVLLKEQSQFKDRKELLAAIEHRLCEALGDTDCRDKGAFRSHFAKCEDKLFTRGAAKQFSVEPHLLIPKNTVAGPGERAGRGQSLVVNATTYPSAVEAYRAVIGEPTTQMNREAIKRALRSAGHSVSD